MTTTIRGSTSPASPNSTLTTTKTAAATDQIATGIDATSDSMAAAIDTTSTSLALTSGS